MQRLTNLTGSGFSVWLVDGRPVLRVGNSEIVYSVGGEGPTGMYWDEMANAVPRDARTVCVLGIGGGTVARLLREKGYTGKIWGVDNSADVLNLGKKYFGLKDTVDVLVYDDAQHFIDKRPYTFDTVIIDTYVGGRPVPLSAARTILNPGGCTIQNDYHEDGSNTVTVGRDG